MFSFFKVVIKLCIYPTKLAKGQNKENEEITLSFLREKKKIWFLAPVKERKGESDPNPPSRVRLQGKFLLKRSCSSMSFKRGDKLSSQQKLSLHRALSL